MNVIGLTSPTWWFIVPQGGINSNLRNGGLYIKSLVPGGAAERDGRLHPGMMSRCQLLPMHTAKDRHRQYNPPGTLSVHLTVFSLCGWVYFVRVCVCVHVCVCVCATDDRLLEVDGLRLDDFTYQQAVECLTKTGEVRG